MSKHNVLMGSRAVAEAVALASPKVITAYPITPQTGIIESLSVLKESGRLPGCEFITVESEHSAIAVLVGAAQTGARCFTATSSHGLFYMYEVLHWVAGARLPIVMVNANRAVGAPWNIQSDRTDGHATRDTGWLQLYCEDHQEVFDSTLMAFRIASQTLLPVMVNLDGFYLTHTSEPVALCSKEEADAFLGHTRMPHAIDPKKPCSISASGTSDYYFRIKEEMANAQRDAGRVIAEVGDRFAKHFGRRHRAVETYRMEDADIALVITGSTTRIARDAVDQLRLRGVKVGIVKFWSFRPFPALELRLALDHVKKVVTFDVNQYDIVLSEVRNALYGRTTPVFGFTVGVGGAPIPVSVFSGIVDEVAMLDAPKESYSLWRGVAPVTVVIEPKVETLPMPVKSSSQFLSPGHRACAGCTASLVMRHTLDVLGKTTQVALPACCWSIIAGPNPYTPVRVPLVHCPFETAAATASGLKRAATALGKDITAVAFAGDGGTFDIGLQALSGAAERGEKIVYICYDNEAYMNTGGQRSSSSPLHSATKTTPGGKPETKKNILEIVAAHNVRYAATASIYNLADFKMKLAKAKRYAKEGFCFIHVIAPCNPGWGIDPSQSLRMAQLAVETNIFPLVEVECGKWRITYRPEKVVDLTEYLAPQGRFAKLTPEEIAEAKQHVRLYWEKLEKLEKLF
ncbi:MAG: hypothetical protein A2845_04645 [Candidatus Lloydbacteria bacterium RIFCSPHIGHO2_01_FULL_49_22]|uniref:Pyruvate ferredoxin oxidoreductase n=1 Tax=Candidatus Lloydbacteria bacterium RIFCSPHIGHO2_01_FULL_49_22 TaxID=1798658 RepID=A0A1G2CYA0_9BACT|nr:MAG: hypothetical protein A2845_04645 [Candidatus Lloydbacteria bacterium RIFCSPHIGHO2_01_FULL_49_22]OGZ10104.1 MAG: hypothetical protein A3C14_00680 [Candidatus Lloydbacteria bacterium RIFCSPHIGHO2_02_FULL_50_18]